MEYTGNSYRVREEFSCLPQATIIIHSFIFSGVEICVPSRHVDQRFLHHWIRVYEFGELSARPYIVVVLVDLL